MQKEKTQEDFFHFLDSLEEKVRAEPKRDETIDPFLSSLGLDFLEKPQEEKEPDPLSFLNEIGFQDTDDNLVVHQAKDLNPSDKYYVPPIDVFEAGRQYIDDFEKACEEEGEGYEAPSYPLWSEKMEGLANGFYIFAGFSNSGKTGLAFNIALDYAMHEENHLYLLYYSLDDTKEDVMARIMASRKRIPISVCRKPNRYRKKIERGENNSSLYAKQLQAREEGLKWMKINSRRFMVRDGDSIDCIERMLGHAKMVKNFLQVRDEKANVIIVIDSLMDIHIDSEKFRDEREKNNEISQLVKKYAVSEIKCPIFGTAHVKKNSGRRISISDLKESGRYEYDAKIVFLITNDVSRNGQNAEIYFTSQNDEKKHPVLEVYWSKNKASSFKERTYYFFDPECSYIREADEETTRQYDSIIYAD